MEINLSLSKLFEQAFGYKSPAFDPVFDPVIGDKAGKRKETGKYGSDYYASDVLGREYYLPIEVQVGHDLIPGTQTSYADKLGASDGYGSVSGRWNLPYPVMSIDLKPHVIDTELTERNGVVSELINISGYKISIHGLLINQKANEFPEDDFDMLNRLANLQTAFRINNVKTDIVLLDSGNSDKLVSVRNLSFPKYPGVKHVQPYELELFSEVPFNLIDIS